jgi:hypothetical protein
VSKEEFKEALFETVGESVLDRAIEAIKKYTQEELPPPELRGKKLKASLNRLAYEAKQWDAE